MISARRNGSWTTAAAIVVAVVSGAVGAGTVDLSKTRPARAFARHSDAPMAKGTGDCKHFAEHYPTLGAAFRWHEKHANVKNSLDCRRVEQRWTCEASFIFNDRKESEKDWALSLQFSVDEAGRVTGLNCAAAG